MSVLALRAVRDPGLGPLTFDFGPGVHVVLGDWAPTLDRLVELLAGVRQPRSGHVIWEGRLLGKTPALRREVGALLGEEELLPARSVLSALQTALELHASSLNAATLLRNVGLAALADREPRALEPRERRAIALALALALEPVRILVLADPLAVAPLVSRELILQACHARAEQSVVVITTCRPQDALELGGRVVRLVGGQLHVEPYVMPPGSACELCVQASDTRRLAALLATTSAVQGVGFQEPLAQGIWVRGADLEALARAVATAASDAGIQLYSVSPRIVPGATHEAAAATHVDVQRGAASIFGRAKATP